MMIKQQHVLVFLVGLVAWPLQVHAEATGFFSRYNIGVSYSTTTSYASISYDAPIVPNLPQDCSQSTGSSSLMHCEAFLGPDSSNSADINVYIEKPFKREGLFYFEPGFTFSTISYKGGLASKPSSPIKSGGSSTNKSSTASAQGPTQGPTQGGSSSDPAAQAGTQPLTQAYMEMYGINWQAFLRFGITPEYFPDVMLSLGLGLQTAGGRLKIFKTDKTRFVAQPEAFAELELVLVRAWSGSLAVFIGQDQTLSGQIGTRLISDYPSGTTLSNFQLSLVAGSAGVRLLFPF